MKLRSLSSSMILHGTLLGGVAWVLGAGLSQAGREPVVLTLAPTLASQAAPVDADSPLEEVLEVEATPSDCELSPDPLSAESSTAIFEPEEKAYDLAPFRDTAFMDTAWTAPIAKKTALTPAAANAPAAAKTEPVIEAKPEIAEKAATHVVKPQPAPESSRVEAVPLDDRNEAPQYPPGARRRGQEGEVLLRLQISASGVVTHAELAKGCPYRSLNRAALRAARSWVFSPARENGLAVAVTTTFPVVFRLEDPARNLP